MAASSASVTTTSIPTLEGYEIWASAVAPTLKSWIK